MLWCALFLIVLIWGSAIVWAAWRARWIVAAIVGLASVLGVILTSQWIGGHDPIGYGVALGLSIFLAGAMIVLGGIASVVTWLARRDRA